MKKGLKKQIALLLSAMMIFSASASAFPAMAKNNTIHSDNEFYNSESEITVTTCESEENPLETETTTVSTTKEVFVQYVEEQTESNPVEVYNSDYAVYAVSSSDEYEQPEGDGTQSNPYQISNSSQLFWFAQQVNNERKTSISAVLTKDIVVNENIFDEDGNLNSSSTPTKWTPIGNESNKYIGTFDGNNHTISGLYFNDNNTRYVGLFGYNKGTIKNVGIIDSYFKGFNCVGGVCGSNYGTVENSYNTGLVSGSSTVGGVCGNNFGTIENSYNTGSVSGSSTVGGVCGYNYYGVTIKNSYNTGSISGSSNYVGGVCANNYGTIENSYNIGSVSGLSSVGGVCGYNNGGEITKSYNTGSISGSSNYVGGICGANSWGTIENNYYRENCNAEGIKFTNSLGIARTSEQFASGEVAYLLGEIWGQEIEKDNLPVLNGKKVYRNIICSGCCEEHQGDITYVYSNTEANPVYSEHQYENGICTVCGAYEPAPLKNKYYQISNAGNLLWFAQQVNSGNLDINAVLTTDIVVNEKVLNADGTLVTDFEKLRIWTPIGNDLNNYMGTFDGKNHTISGLYFNNENTVYVGLFGHSYSGTIKNVGIIDSYFKGKYNVGGVCGYNSGTIENTYNTGTVSGSYWVGGVCGNNSHFDKYNGTIENTYNTGLVSGSSSMIGGVCGYNNKATITNSYNTGTIDGPRYVGGVCGFNNDDSIITNSYYLENCNATGTTFTNNYGIEKTSAQFASGEVAYLLQYEQETAVWGQEIDKDNLPVLNGKKVYANRTYSGCCEKYQGDIIECEYSNTQTDTIYLGNHNFKSGLCVCGTYESEPELKNEYYQIENAGHLYWFAQQVNNGNLYINAVLTTNIVVNANVLNADGTLNTDLKNLIEWTPIGNSSRQYQGTFDGNNHTISGLYFDDEGIKYVGLFGYNSGTIKDVGIIDSYFKGKHHVGGVCGYNKGTIENSYNTGTVSGLSNTDVGGVCGYNKGTIENSYNTGTVSGSSYNTVGGVCGFNENSTIAKCYNTGTISGNINVGGVCGRNYNGTIAKCYNTGTISGVSISTNKSNSIGGICGQSFNGIIADSYNRGTVSGSDWNVGGICGYNYGMVENCYNTGSVSGVKDVGGVCGNNHINNFETKGTIANSYNTGTVRGLENVGGVSGQNIDNAIITNSYNTGTVIGLDDNNNNNNNNNNNKNNYYVGGVCGYNYDGSTIKNSYNIGLVSVLSDRYSVGGVCGYNNGTIENSYYLKNCNAEGTTFTNNDGTEKTYAQFESGEVAYLLQKGQEAEIWGQEITKDRLPVLNSRDKVYKAIAYSSIENEIISEIYLNNSLTVIMTAVAPIKEGYNFKGWYAYDESNDNRYTGDILSSSREYDLNVTADSEFMAVYEPLGTADITINCDREYTINGVSKSSATTEKYSIGSTIKLSCSDENFAYWQNSAGTILSRENKYSFVVTNEETISAVFNEKVDNKVTLIFESFYGQVIATEQLGSGEKIDNPDLPVRTGYTALGWDFDGDGKFTENDTLENAIEIGLRLDSKTVKIVPVYELIDTTHRINVINGTGSGAYKKNDIVTATPNKAETGMKFSHWEDSDGNILSYNEKYVFYVSKNMTVKAVYVKTETKIDAKGTTGIVELNKTTNNKLSFVSMSTVPEGCKINKAGIIATDDSTIGKSDNFTDKNAKFVRGMSSDKKAVRYTWTKGNVKSGQTWYVRAYLVYTDSNGNVHTIYGDMESQTYQ